MTPTCATAIPLRILSLVRVAHAKERDGLSTVALCLLLNPGGLCN